MTEQDRSLSTMVESQRGEDPGYRQPLVYIPQDWYIYYYLSQRLPALPLNHSFQSAQYGVRRQCEKRTTSIALFRTSFGSAILLLMPTIVRPNDQIRVYLQPYSSVLRIQRSPHTTT
ncbi:uncharacterized protein LAJ45_10135 [Morchella importuna]|uniref:uncharacterized protein n=1 Tax=Morchella importuna TaxID=1174673 RepID=UPI001E8E889C|nr:uncharacterized protein LAJ45_10135 [Morchella importuna]KAH8145812.1 hypothetical protein LAJ45_10135 [Morchella importuna]